MGDAERWDERHRSTPTEELSWFQATATMSLGLVAELGVGLDDPILDVGGGVSTFVDGLLDAGHRDVTVLDVSTAALDIARSRLPPDAPVIWMTADVTAWRPPRRWHLWHDRATFHFLTDADRRAAYLTAMDAALEPGGVAIIATFAGDGPERCSGRTVRRYDPGRLLEEVRAVVDVELIAERRQLHPTPTGATQPFTWIAVRRR